MQKLLGKKLHTQLAANLNGGDIRAPIGPQAPTIPHVLEAAFPE